MTAQEQVRKYFREVMEKRQLPPLPAVVSTVLKMIENSDLDMRKLCRVLADDAALASRILTISRSLYYAQRTPPTSLQGAIQVLGLRTLRSVVLASAAQSFFLSDTKVSEKLWRHSLTAALASRILSRRAGWHDTEQAFLAGLLHDVGEMILLHGDPRGFEKICQEAQSEQRGLPEKEKETYGFDHTLIGVTLLDCWNLDSQIGPAVLQHHNYEGENDPKALTTLVRLADYLCFQADLSFFCEPPSPPTELLSYFGCDSEESLVRLVEEVRQAFHVENALFHSS